MQGQKTFQSKHRTRRQYNPDDINIAKLFTAIREHRTGNPPKDKLGEITILLDQIQNINDIDYNDNGNTLLHVAVNTDDEDIVKLLLINGAKVDIKNNIGDSPPDIANKSNKKKIVQLLETHRNSIAQETLIGYSRSGPSSQIHSRQQTGQSTLEAGVRRSGDIGKPLCQVEILAGKEEVEKKLTEFVEDLVSIYESSLSEYYERLENQISKPGKWANFVNKVIETGTGATEGIEVAGKKASSIVGINILQSIVSSTSAWHNRKKLKKLIHQLYIFKENPCKVREELVKSGIEIFQGFESQFTQLTSNGSWQRAMAKLAEDAVGRVIDHFRKNTKEEFENAKEEFSASSITKGVILGKSKRYKYTFTHIPHLNPGHTLEYKKSNSWNTAKLFNKTGLVILKSDGTADKYYKKKDGKSDTSKYYYGYRLLFQWESQNTVNEKYCEEKPTSEEYRYILKPNEKKELEDILLDKINKEDPKLMEKRLIKHYEKGIKRIEKEAEENVKKLEKIISNNFDNLSSYIETHQNEIRTILNRIEQKSSKYHQEASQQRQEIVNSIDKGFEQTHQKLDKIVAEQKSKPVRKPISFDIRESVESFTGRQEQLDQIAIAIKQGIVVISGLGGVGKSELAIKYAHTYYNGNVIWINAETHETAKDSFRRLLKELERKTIDQDGEEKSVRVMAKEVYDFFAAKKPLFIFDNAKEHLIVKKFLPLGTNGYHVLITSQNLQLFNEQHRKIERVRLDILPEDEAIEFVKKALNIYNTLQDKEIKELVRTLGYLPLALQYAASYIKVSGYVGTIDKYLDIYTRSEQESQCFLNLEGLSSYDKNIFLTFKTTIDEVKQKSKLAEDILNTIAYFSPDNIPKKTFFKLAQDEIEESDVSIKNDRAEGTLTRAINLLGQYSIINLKEKQVSIHKLVQEVIRSELKEQNEEGVLGKALGLLKGYTKAAPGNTASCIPHVISIWDYASKYDELINSFIVNSTNNKATTSTTYFDLVIEGSNYEVIDAILKKINSDNLKEVINGKSKDDVTPLHKAVLRNDKKIVKLVIDNDADVNAKKSNGWTPLHLAAKNGNLEIVNALLEKRAGVDAETKYKFTPLHLAARNGHKEVIEALLTKNANVGAKTEYEFTPLHLAADNGHLDTVHALLKNNQIIINAETKDKYTPLHLAAKSGHLNVVEALLIKNADINAQNKDYYTPLHLAALNGHAKIVTKLLENYKIVIDARTTKGNTPLHLAVERGHLEIVKALIAKNADINLTLMEGGADILARNNHDTVLHQAVSSNNEEVIRLILEKIKEKYSQRFFEHINVRDTEGDTPLMWAAENEKTNAAEILLEYGADPNARNDIGETALHWAAKGSYQEVLQLLLNKQADPNIKDKNGKTPLDLAQEKLFLDPDNDNLKRIVTLLLSVTDKSQHQEERALGLVSVEDCLPSTNLI